MRRSAPARRAREGILVLAGSAAGLLGGACHIAGAKVWNLEQVHEPDGTPRRAGRVQNDIAYLVGQAFRKTNFGGADFQEEQQAPEKIEDPLGTCLENVVELGRCRPDEKVAGLQASAFSWLAVDCTYVLSRERCTLELGRLAQRLGLRAAPAPVPAEGATSIEGVRAAFDELLAGVRAALTTPGVAAPETAELCDRIRALPLDRAGSLRLLRAANGILEGSRSVAALAPVAALRLDLARRCVGLALGAARQDPHGRVRAAALESGTLAFPEERAELLRWALVEPMEGVQARTELSLRALELLARHGLPPAPEGESPERFRSAWTDLLVQVLRRDVDGRHTSAACAAMARITGEAPTLRPEVWVARARATASASGQGPAGVTP